MTRDDAATRDIPRSCICRWEWFATRHRWERTRWYRGCHWHIDEGRTA